MVATLATHGDDATIRSRSRRPHFEDFALYVKHGAGPNRAGPRDLAAGSDDSAGNGQAALHQEPHGDRRRVPTARYESSEERRLPSRGVEVERLGIKLLGERADLFFVN